ncbi:hypothetical protein ACIP6Q_39320 [Streptomyces bobili]
MRWSKRGFDTYDRRQLEMSVGVFLRGMEALLARAHAASAQEDV